MVVVDQSPVAADPAAEVPAVGEVQPTTAEAPTVGVDQMAVEVQMVAATAAVRHPQAVAVSIQAAAQGLPRLMVVCPLLAFPSPHRSYCWPSAPPAYSPEHAAGIVLDPSDAGFDA